MVRKSDTQEIKLLYQERTARQVEKLAQELDMSIGDLSQFLYGNRYQVPKWVSKKRKASIEDLLAINRTLQREGKKERVNILYILFGIEA